MEVRQSINLQHPPDAVWAFFRDTLAVARCVPGAEVTKIRDDGGIVGRLVMRLGPITGNFEGTARIEFDDKARKGTAQASGSDRQSSSRTTGTMRFGLKDGDADGMTRVDVEIEFKLSGPLAQFSRPGIVKEVANQLAAQFAQNVDADLSASSGEQSDDAPADTSAGRELKVGAMMGVMFWQKVRAFFHRILGRGS